MEKVLKNVLGIIFIITLVFAQTGIVFALSKSDLEPQQNQNAKEIEQIEQDIKEIEAKKSKTMKEVENLINQISDYESQLDKLNSQISSLEDKISQVEKDIVVKEEEYNEQREVANDMLVDIYKRGETSYLDVLLSSSSVVDFISKYYLMSQLTDYNIELLESIEKERIEIENIKAELENNKKELDTAKNEKQTKYNELKNAQAQKNQYVSKLSAEEKQEQEELEKYKADQREIQRQLEEIARRESNQNGNIASTPSKSGYIFPIPGLSKANINNKTYPSYSGHTGVDININVIGKNVVAVKSGTVEISTAKKGSISNYDSNGKYIGGYSSYGEYIIINHHDGTMTLYGHMKPGSRRVSAGQEVKQGQIIGTVGNTGNCQPRPTPSNPTAGTHLHFEVRINGSPVNPLPYLP